MLWSHICILVRLLAAEPRITALPLFPSLSLRNGLADPVFDGVGLAGFMNRANYAFSLIFHGFICLPCIIAARYFLVFYCFPFLTFFLHVGIVGLGSFN